jgi:PAS domain S-box-containing protein
MPEVAEQQNASARLRESEASLRALVEAAQDYAMFRLDIEGRVVTWNTGAERVKGYSSSEILGKHFSCFYTMEDQICGKPEAQLQQALRWGCSQEHGWQLRKDGSKFWASVVITALRDENDRLLGFAKITQDISERKQMEDALRQREAILDAFFQVSPVGLAILDRDLRFQRVNETLAAINGLTPDEHLGKSPAEVMPELAPKIEPRIRQVLETGEASLNHEVRGPRPGQDGAVGYWQANYFPISDEAGRISQLGAVVLDITDCRRAEECLRRLSGRLMELQDQERRRIARELHDSIGQCLVALKMNLEIVERALLSQPAGSSARQVLAESLELAQQCSTDTRTISYLLHPPLLDERGVASAIRWYADGFAQRSGIELSLDLPPDGTRLPQPLETTLFRIVQECLTNIHRHSESSVAEIRLLIDAENAILEVKDKGRGMPSASLNRYNGNARAIGVGIAGMRERVRQLGGFLDIQSRPGNTVVRATLPVGGEP